MRRLVGLAAAALLLQACASGGGPSSGESVTKEGTVTAVDPSPIYSDVDGIVVLRTGEGEVVTVVVPARVDLCQATGLPTIHLLRVGDRVRAVGALVEPSVLRACTGSDHLLERLP